MTSDLQRDVVVRQSGGREDRQLLTAHQRGAAVDGRDSRLDELLRHLATVGVDRRADDVGVLLRHDLRPVVSGFTGAGQDASDEPLAHRQFEHVTEECHPGPQVDAGCSFEHLHGDQVVAGVQHLSVLDGAIRQAQADDLAEGDRLCVCEEDQRSLHVGYGSVFFHTHLNPSFRRPPPSLGSRCTCRQRVPPSSPDNPPPAERASRWCALER